MTSARCSLLIASIALAAPACVHRPLPLPMAPVREIALEQPLCGETLAVLDFADERPAFERSAQEIDEKDIGGRWVATDRFYSFHPEDRTLPGDPASVPDLRARVTGAAAFAWYPFPNHGIGTPAVRTLDVAIADYVALQLEQRGLFARVIRTRDLDAARAAGATIVLSGRIDRFGALLAEAHDPFVVRPDDWIQFRLLAAAAYDATLRRLAEEKPLLERSCLGRDEDLHLFDRLAGYRGSQARPLYELDAEDFPAYAQEDMATHARRALERATAPLVAAIEHALTPGAPAP